MKKEQQRKLIYDIRKLECWILENGFASPADDCLMRNHPSVAFLTVLATATKRLLGWDGYDYRRVSYSPAVEAFKAVEKLADEYIQFPTLFSDRTARAWFCLIRQSAFEAFIKESQSGKQFYGSALFSGPRAGCAHYWEAESWVRDGGAE